MKEFEIEWGYYLQAYRLQQGLSRNSNAESQRLLHRALDTARQNKRDIARGHGLLSFAILSAWLNDWIDPAEEELLAAACVQDSAPATTPRLSTTHVQDDKRISDRANIIPHVIHDYGHNALDLDKSDYDNVWSAATADLYSGNYAAALVNYKEALRLADTPDVPVIALGSLMVDFADFRFFAGNDELDDSDEAWIGAIKDAIRITHDAINRNQDDGKHHRWYWTLGWAHYEMAAYVDAEDNLKQSRDYLEMLRSPHNLIRKNLIATYTALGDSERAAEHVSAFKSNNPSYKIEIENRWPYRIDARRDRFKSHLAQGLGIRFKR